MEHDAKFNSDGCKDMVDCGWKTMEPTLQL